MARSILDDTVLARKYTSEAGTVNSIHVLVDWNLLLLLWLKCQNSDNYYNGADIERG